MLKFVEMIADFWKQIIAVFDRYPVQIGDFTVSVIWLIFAFIAVGFVVSYYWKGARA